MSLPATMGRGHILSPVSGLLIFFLGPPVVGAAQTPPAGHYRLPAISAPPLLAELDDVPGTEIVVLAGARGVHVLDRRGRPHPGWPRTARPGLVPPVLAADIDGDGGDEIFCGREGGGIVGWRIDGSLVMECAPDAGSGRTVSLAAGDLDADGRPDIVEVRDEGTIAVWTEGGRALEGWPRSLGATVYGQVTVAPVDGRPGDEVLVGDARGRLHLVGGDGSHLSGWPVSLGAIIRASPVAMPCGTDVVCLLAAPLQYHGQLHAFAETGETMPGWPAEVGGLVNDGPALGDIDGDGDWEAVLTQRQGTVYVVHHDGVMDHHWPRRVGGEIRHGPVLGDVTGDGRPEVVVVNDRRELWIWDAEGRLLPGWPRDLPAEPVGPPALGDIDGEGRVELVMAFHGGELLSWETEGIARSRALPWPSERGGPLRRGIPVDCLSPEGNGAGPAGPAELRIWQNLPSPSAWENTIEIEIPPGASRVVLELLSEEGEPIAALITGELAPGFHRLANPGREAAFPGEMPGTGESGVGRVPAGYYRARLVADADTVETEILVLP